MIVSDHSLFRFRLPYPAGSNAARNACLGYTYITMCPRDVILIKCRNSVATILQYGVPEANGEQIRIHIIIGINPPSSVVFRYFNKKQHYTTNLYALQANNKQVTSKLNYAQNGTIVYPKYFEGSCQRQVNSTILRQSKITNFSQIKKAIAIIHRNAPK